MLDISVHGTPMHPGEGIMFLRRMPEGTWIASWEKRPNAVGAEGTEREVRSWVRTCRPERAVIWDDQANDYIDFRDTDNQV